MAMNFGTIAFSSSFKRTSAFPLDALSYFESYDAAVAAAATAEEVGSKNTVYHYGQDMVVVENGVATKYIVQPDKTLAKVGGSIEINEDVFAHDADGKLSLFGFAEAVAGAQLTKSADGKLSWVKPDTTTVEGLSTEVENLRNDVNTINTGIAALDARIAEAEGKLTGVFHFKGAAPEGGLEAISEKSIGDVYTIEDKEYAWNGTDWTELGSTCDLSAYSTTEQMNGAIEEGVNTAKGYADSLAGNYAPAEEFNSHKEDADIHVTAEKQTAWDDAVAKSHEHANKTILDIINQEKIDNWDGAVEKQHEHANKTVLDLISEEKVAQWDNAQANIIEEVQFAGVVATITEKKLNIPAATDAQLGLVKVDNDTIEADAEGTIGVKAIGVSKLFVEEGTELVLDGGNA